MNSHRERAFGSVALTWIASSAAWMLLAGCHEPVSTQPLALLSLTNRSGIAMVSLPGGWFNMGSSDKDEPDQKLHRVYVSAFVMDKFPVTQESYERLMRTNPSHWKGPARSSGAVGTPPPANGRFPVEQIRWRDAALYCNARSRAEGLDPVYDTNTWACHFDANGYRLPTEAEYEYALRAGSSTTYFFGESADDLKRYVWFKENSPRGPHPVGEKPANAWGLCDLIGNIWEWCNDYYQEDYYEHGPERDPRGPATGQNRVVRGGCWNSKPEHCRSAYRNYEMPAYTDACFAKDLRGQIGFRCVRKP